MEKSSSQSQFTSISNLEKNCEKLLKDNTSLQSEIMNLKAMNSKLQSISTINGLTVENTHYKIAGDSSFKTNQNQYDVKLSELRNITLDSSCQTENVQSLNESTFFETINIDEEQKRIYSNYAEENAELKLQISAYIKKLEALEEEQNKEKYIYEQLFKKGIQAAKLSDNEVKYFISIISTRFPIAQNQA